MPTMKKCYCRTYMKRGPVIAERNGRVVVLTRFKQFDCPKCGYSEVVEVKIAKKK